MGSLFEGVPYPGLIALSIVVVVVALVAWGLQLMQSASDKQEFSLMLAGCLVCSAAAGLATVMMITLTGPDAPLVHVLQAGAQAIDEPQW
ncbi:MAG: hypothetical protein DBW85_00375 [Synechococcus sp. MED-G71]|nr:MAG: hypothetical protein DBW85_00375 [Synechococcus sp. MED-G71]